MLRNNIEKIEIKGDHAILKLTGFTDEQACQVRQSLNALWPNKNVLIILDAGGLDISQLNEEEMNAAGWYRKESTDE